MKRFEGKVVAIAGGAGGIGTAVSRRLAAEGAAVMVGDLNFEDASRVCDLIKGDGGCATPFRLSLGEEASIVEFLAQTITLHGGLDGFHCNASDSSRRDEDNNVATMDMSAYDQMMDVNTRGFFLCTRHALPHLVRRGGGAMLYTSSGAAYMGEVPRPVYAMGKSAIHALSRNIASHWGKRGIRSNVISPGLIVHDAVRSAMGQKFIEDTLKSVPVGRLGAPDDIAAMAALLLSDEGSFVTGQVICVDGGVTMRP
jgi:NAD(P)-dependent dehydrogenase (short-subunit alcohol dehydrogenase family)